MRRVFGAVWRFFGGETHRRQLQHVQGAARDLLARSDTNPPTAAPPLQQFEDFQRFYRVSELDLRVLHRQRAAQVYFLAGCALFAVAFGATSAWLRSGPPLAALAVLLALLFLAVAARHSLRAWQIRERRLGSFGEWLRRPRVWFPSRSIR